MPDYEFIIIGAGIAGAAAAHELRGRDVLILDSAPGIAQGASGNPKGIFRPFLSFGDDAMRKFYQAAYYHALDVMDTLSLPVLQRGILQFPKDESEKRFSQAPAQAGFGPEDLQHLSAAAASEILKTDCRSEALYWPHTAIIDPAVWVRALIGKTDIRIGARIQKIFHDKFWHAAADQNEILTAKNIILACGNHIEFLPLEIQNQIRPRAGQITMVPRVLLPELLHALTFGHYTIPPQSVDDVHIIGATYEHSAKAAVTTQGHAQNITALKKLARILPALFESAARLTLSDCTGRAAVRATTANHLPLYGQAAPGLFYLTGLGSRGLMSAPYAARQLCKLFRG